MVEYDIRIGYYDVEVIPPAIKNAMAIYAWFVEVVNVFIYCIMVRVVLRYSTREIGAYKWYIIGCQTCCVFTFIVKAMIEDEPLFPYDVTVLGGLAGLFPNNDHVVRFFFALFHMFFVGHFSCVTLMFLFRFAQTTGHLRMVQLMSSKRILFYAYIPWAICVVVLTLLDALYSIPNIDKYVEKFGDSNPKIAAYIKSKPLLVEVNTWYTNYERYVPTLSGLLICAYCTYGCYNFKTKRNDCFSDRTKALYRTLINALLIEMLVIAVAVVTPVLVCQEFIGVEYRPLGTALMWRWLYLYPTFTMIFTMSYISCYRDGFRKLVLKLLFGVNAKNGIVVLRSASSIVSATRSSPY
ncbi:unnamed protein product [Bursaphelenchus xylophilus]|uniref:(pine wood nematode) hypothetical protein n=1 Tax=Bursaphelenchus xylophilus TaxID=6326 RepID=A0A1I7S5N1_BURXY|nr:unnamed protein product [Bursaphelenchus xylophilus]CAG9124889.1 unnamed protein product [Bursaphelenchus xylophilus]